MRKKKIREQNATASIAGYNAPMGHSCKTPKEGWFAHDIRQRERKFHRKRAKKAFNKKSRPSQKTPPAQWEELNEVFVSSLLSLINESEMRVANEILRQIKAVDRWALGAWGAKDFIGDKNALIFRVRGPKMMTGGKIKITLNGKDYYDVEAFQIRAGKVKLLKKLDDIDIENLVKAIDGLVG